MDPQEAFFAHTLDGRPQGEWEGLRTHLQAVAHRAASFGERFGAGEWARIAGLWHDLGKYSEAFQKYLKDTNSPDPHQAELEGERGQSATRVDHSTAGAQHAVAANPLFGQILAYAIAGHHSGLLDWRRDGACLNHRLEKAIEPWNAAPLDLKEVPITEPPASLRLAFRHSGKERGFAAALFTRMLFSCLVDADFLETERFVNPDRCCQRPRWPADVLHRMAAALDEHVAGFKLEQSTVNRQRAEVRQACLDAAGHKPGLFSLTVPTGGGKTLSSLAFALRHAQRWDLERVIYVAPFTTIIEQNADAFRTALRSLNSQGLPDPIVEHHSNLDVGKETYTSRLATENWDAPLIVTTSVQFYESLFANRTSRCRKLHHLARSVIVLDEAQCLPVDLLKPCLRTLEELSRAYGTSIVLCTATQPAIHKREDFSIGLEGVTEIVPDPQHLYSSLRRVEVRYLDRLRDDPLAEHLAAEEQVLCIVNTRGHARTLFDKLGKGEGHFHLSALMCPEHRSARLKTIRGRLDKKKPCRVISTQLIEAGVDIDFPAVYRSFTGLDSIAQAAGRCNRAGRLPELGRVYVFRSEHSRSESLWVDVKNCAAQLISQADPLALDVIEHYFRLYFWENVDRWDAKGILQEFRVNDTPPTPFRFAFQKVAKLFRLIEETTQPVSIPWGEEGRHLCETLRESREFPDRLLLRKLQRYTVQVPKRLFDTHVGRSIDLVHERFPVLINLETNYCDDVGLDLDGDFAGFMNA